MRPDQNPGQGVPNSALIGEEEPDPFAIFENDGAANRLEGDGYVILNEDFEYEAWGDQTLWKGDLEHFTIIEDEGDETRNRLLRLDAEQGIQRSQIYTESHAAYGEWGFYLEVPASTTTNRVYIYLLSDSHQLDVVGGQATGDANGYAIHAGHNGFELVRLDNGNATTLLSSIPEIQSKQGYRVVVTRSLENEWRMQVHDATDSEPEELSGPVVDSTYTSSQYFGIFVRYTNLNRQNYYFDNLLVTAAITDFFLNQAEVVSSNQLDLTFSNGIDDTGLSAENFHVNNGIGFPVSVELADPGRVRLTFSELFANGDYTVSVSGIEDIYEQVIDPGTSADFTVTNPFIVTGFRTVNRSEFEITFSQDVESAAASDFVITGYGNPLEIRSDQPDGIRLIYDRELAPGNHELIINHIKSDHQWEIEANTVIEFGVYEPYEPGDLVISEFFYRTPVSWRTAEFDRPQYIEIYNRSDKLLNLRNFTVNGENIRSEADLPIQPEGYLVLARGVSVFERRFDRVYDLRNFVEAERFPRLNLTKTDDIILATPEGAVADSLTYSASEWGGNEAALERVDFGVPAFYRDNWAESQDALLGSPGLKNTVHPPSDPPEVVAADFPSPFVLHITFSGTLTDRSVEDLLSYELSGGVMPQSVNRLKENVRTVEFHLDQRLEDQADYRFHYTGVDDIFGNQATGGFHFKFENPFQIRSAEVEGTTDLVMKLTLPIPAESCNNATFTLSGGRETPDFTCRQDDSETIRLVFGSALDTGRYRVTVSGLESFVPGLPDQWLLETGSTAEFFRFDEYQPGDIVLNEFMYRPPSGFPRYVEIKNVSDRFLSLKNFELRRTEGTSSNGGTISEFDRALEPYGFAVITDDSALLESAFGQESGIQMNGFPGFTVTSPDQIRLLDPDGELIEQIHYHPQVWGGNGIALERRSTKAVANSVHNWGESEAELPGTPGLENTVQPLQDAPALLSAGFIDERNVEVIFSGAVDPTAVSESNFSVSGGRNVQQLVFTSDSRAVLTLDKEMQSGSRYVLTVREVPDIFGNMLNRDQSGFTYYHLQTAEPGDVVINEFMYRPPEPYTRYIELYNRSGKAVDLSGWQQANDTGTRRVLTTERIILPPKEYIVLLPNPGLLSQFPDLNALDAGTALSALKAGGDSILITNAEGMVIDSLAYHPSWGGNGVALERRHADRSPLYAENWGDSPAETYGTPGRANEVEKNFELIVIRIGAIGREEVEMEFNVPVREQDLLAGNFQTRGWSPGTVSLIDEATVRLQFSEALPVGEGSMHIQNIHSRGGFSIAGGYSIPFIVFDTYEEGDILVNEFMYRPPESYPRYIELYNRSGKLLNLKNWRLQRRQIASESERLITTEDLPVEPEGFLVLTDDLAAFQEIYPERNVMELSAFPGFTVTTPDQIRLFTADDFLADSLEYTPSLWGGNEVALERLSLKVSATLRENWKESPHALLGTPGLPNEARPDSEPPQIVHAELFEDLGFRLVFSKMLDEESALNRDHYQTEPLLHISMTAMEESGVILFINDHLENDQLYTIRVNGVKDLFGIEMEPAEVQIRYLEFGETEPGDLVINEILYRRQGPGYPEFIEIYNRTGNHADLSGWQLGNADAAAILPRGTAIRADDYLVFTDEPAFAATSEKILYLPDFKTLGNSEDTVVLKNLHGSVIDSVSYRSGWGEQRAGLSLERKDPSALSIDPGNWSSSSDESGSTPARKNSRFEPDVHPPFIRFANRIHPDSIEVLFDSFVDLNSSRELLTQHRTMGPSHSLQEQKESARFLLNGREADVIHYNPHQADRIILSADGVQWGEEVVLAVENLADFQGNHSASLSQPVAQPLQKGELVINEIMFRPIADSHDGYQDQSEYLEIYNRMPYALSLEGIFIHDTPDENGGVTRLDPVSTHARWIPANGYVLFYPEPEPVPFTESRTARFFHLTEDMAPFAMQIMRNTLGLPNTGREISLADSTGAIIDRVHYSDSWHNPNLVDTRGISLERVNPDLDSGNPLNWGSHVSPLGGTPGTVNSIYQSALNEQSDVGLTLSPNPFSPDSDGYDDHLMIHYKLDETDYLLKVRIYDRYGRLVRRLEDGLPAGLEGTLLWDGRNDKGAKNRIGIYIVVAEAYNSTTGKSRIFRKSAVLARQF